MAGLYVMCLLPIFVGALLWLFTRKFVLWEYLLLVGLSFGAAGIYHYATLNAKTADVETWSGHIQNAVHHPRWVERYTQTHTRRVGKRTETYTTVHYRTHPEYWEAITTTGNKHRIEVSFFNQISQRFGGAKRERAFKSGFSSGDPNIYVASNKENSPIFPTNDPFSWTNKVKASPSLYKHIDVPTSSPAYAYPKNADWLNSDRVVGEAKRFFSTKAWDTMNARLGPKKKVNVVVVGFKNQPSSVADEQEAKWLGGKKNDLVLCFGVDGNTTSVLWSRTFGWTEEALVKRNIDTIILAGITPQTLSLIEKEVEKNFEPKDWSKFDYLEVDVPLSAYLWFFLILVLLNGGVIYFTMKNQIGKEKTIMDFAEDTTVQEPVKRSEYKTMPEHLPDWNMPPPPPPPAPEYTYVDHSKPVDYRRMEIDQSGNDLQFGPNKGKNGRKRRNGKAVSKHR